MKHYIATPFSLATDIEYIKAIGHGKIWGKHIQPLVHKGMSEKEAHLAYMYSDDRMDYRFKAFKHICVPRIAQATEKLPSEDWKWIIYVTDYMPERHLISLKECLRDLVSVEIKTIKYGVSINEMGIDFLKRLPTEGRFSTTRLDDDDGVPTDLFERVRHFAPLYSESFIYSNPKICTVNIMDASISYGDIGIHPSQPASGLTAIDRSIHTYGNHTKIKNAHNVEIVRDLESVSETLCGCDANHTTSLREFTNRLRGMSY